jgi:hypothetical protein
VLKEAKSNNLAPVDQINGLSDKLNSCEPVVDLVNDHVAHTANPARNPNMSGSTCPWADLFEAQDAICRVAVSVQRDYFAPESRQRDYASAARRYNGRFQALGAG